MLVECSLDYLNLASPSLTVTENVHRASMEQKKIYHLDVYLRLLQFPFFTTFCSNNSMKAKRSRQAHCTMIALLEMQAYPQKIGLQ